MKRFDRITFEPQKMGGQACIRGLRITAAMIVSEIAAGTTKERLLQAFPELEPADIQQALDYAALRIAEREITVA
jgi:uncharacterized protein (DUF433 family)